jgi:hypothetical protein
MLRSVFDPTARSITLDVELSQPLAAGGRLAVTSIVQLTPPADSAATLERQLASYHELATSQDLSAGETWTIADLQLSHVPNHANDGPMSAFLIRPDDSISPVAVEAMRRSGDVHADVSDGRQDRGDGRSPEVPDVDGEWSLKTGRIRR